MIRRPLRALAPVVLVLALSACGFQLRNALTLPPDLGPVKVVSVDRYSPLAETLATSLSRAGAVPATDAAAPAAVLDLFSERWGDLPIALDAFGRSQEYSLRYAVIFELRRADGTVLVPQQAIELSRDYISAPTNAIGTEGEREVLVRELRREMAAAVLRRIDAVVKRQEGGAASSTLLPVETDAARAAMQAAGTAPPVEDAPPPPAEVKP
ncbi:LPS assembly lipoprotein LptE [Aerolutibacter ruishenii]|uniref:LPS-assembly lipoprotein LptE n=1 Tax=Aerolutibacter ruishenii TaxID=686800 RepID=A0A562LSV5_9GAMM|nr:LPS assembly lipoprotein LptE [Lysobacter ruishenii]TWI10618.1 LPS-assembly lipoprotein [Lysobacter ruishenii]